jgi:hypothetical protein
MSSIISRLFSKKSFFEDIKLTKTIGKLNSDKNMSKLLTKNHTSGEMVLWATSILALYLLILYFI